MIPEIWSETERIFLILDHFTPLPFHPIALPRLLTTQRIKILKKWKKTPTDIIILHKCTTNDNHMIYCSWDMAHDGFNCYFSYWAIFWLFTPITAQKKKISQKWKKLLQISSFYTIAPKIIIIGYTVPEIWRVTDVIIFHLGLFFALLPL